MARSRWKTGHRVMLATLVGGVGVGCLGCSGPQSTLDPAGEGAQQIAVLFWWLVGGSLAIWMTVIGLTIYALRLKPEAHDVTRSRWWIIGGGAVVPTLLLLVLVCFGLAMIPDMVTPDGDDAVKIRVRGAQWWWRVDYQDPNDRTDHLKRSVVDMGRSSRQGTDQATESGEAEKQPELVSMANEIRIPVNRPALLYPESEDVIHSFWIPSLTGKIDMIPGRQNVLTLRPTRTGIYRGACAEYCGDSHALMNFYVVVMEPADFEEWFRAQSQDASPASTEAAIRGKALFISLGCGACHAIRGTEADGQIGPDLTHVGSRVSLAAGRFTGDHPAAPQITKSDFEEWIRNPRHYKPGALMPAFTMLSDQELGDLAAYLIQLK